MTKFIITKKNIPYDNSYKHVFKFQNSKERNQYINNFLFISGNYENEINESDEIIFTKIDSLFAEAIISEEILIKQKINIFNKNYIIIKNLLEKEFYFINKVGKCDELNFNKNVENSSTLSKTYQKNIN